MDNSLYAKTLEQKRRATLTAAGFGGPYTATDLLSVALAPDLPIGSREIGWYDIATKTWSEPASPMPQRH